MAEQWFWVTNERKHFVTVHDADSKDALITIDGIAECFHPACALNTGRNGWVCNYPFLLLNTLRLVRTIDVQNSLGNSWWLLHN